MPEIAQFDHLHGGLHPQSVKTRGGRRGQAVGEQTRGRRLAEAGRHHHKFARDH